MVLYSLSWYLNFAFWWGKCHGAVVFALEAKTLKLVVYSPNFIQSLVCRKFRVRMARKAPWRLPLSWEIFLPCCHLAKKKCYEEWLILEACMYKRQYGELISCYTAGDSGSLSAEESLDLPDEIRFLWSRPLTLDIFG